MSEGFTRPHGVGSTRAGVMGNGFLFRMVVEDAAAAGDDNDDDDDDGGSNSNRSTLWIFTLLA